MRQFEHVHDYEHEYEYEDEYEDEYAHDYGDAHVHDYGLFLNVEAKVHDVAILHDVVLAFDSELPGGFDGLLGAELE